jgi:ABC-type amino acid transport substrate-binding protein
VDSTTLRGIVCALAAAGLLAAGSARADTCPERLRIAFPDTPAEPFLRGQGDEFEATPGLLVDWVLGSLRRLGCLPRAELLRLPARRVRAMIDSGQLDLVAGVGEGGPLAALLTLPPPAGARREFDFSLGQVEYALYARRGLVASRTDGQEAPVLPPQARVGVTAGSRAEMLAKEHGWPVEPAPSHESALQKLLAGRTPLLLVHSYYLDERLRRDATLAGQIERFGPVVERRRLHVGALPAFAQGEGGFVTKLWRELCRQSAAAKADGACRLPPG